MAKVHDRVFLGTDENQDRCRTATVICNGDDDDVSLWIDSVGFGTRVELTHEQAAQLAALLTRAASVETADGYGATGTATLGEVKPDAE